MTVYERKWTTKTGEQRRGWRVQVTTASGKRIQRQFDTKREALAFDRSPHLWDAEAAPRHKFGSAATDWLDWVRRGKGGDAPLEQMTMVMYEGHVRNYIVPWFGDKSWSAIRDRTVEDFRDHLLASVSRSTARRILNTAKMIFRFAVKRQFTTHDPSHDVTIVALRGRHIDRSSERLAIPQPGEIDAILAAARELEVSKHRGRARAWHRYHLMLRLLIFAGLRASELRGLPRNCLKVGRLEVRQRADRRGEIGPPKSAAGYRSIPLPGALAQSLHTHLEATTGQLAFGTSSDAPESHENLTKRMWLVVQREAKVQHFNLHSLRHYYASRLINGGANPLLVSKLMGHANVNITLGVYGHLFTDAVAEAQEKALAEAIFFGERESPGE